MDFYFKIWDKDIQSVISYNNIMKKYSVFIVEDDLVSAQYLKEVLENEGFEVIDIVDNAQEAIDKLKKNPADVVLMDIILKGAMSGSEAAMILQQARPECKIIFLTAYADEEMIEYAEYACASAYLMKPYREKEIIATIRMVMHDGRRNTRTNSNIKLMNGFEFDRTNRRLIKNGIEMPLSEKKLLLIEILAKNKNSVVSNEQLTIDIWGGSGHENNLRSLVSRLRDIIGHEMIINANGLGYMMVSN